MALSPDHANEWRRAVGLALRNAREARGLSQESLAEKAGVDRKLVYRTELGQTSPRLDAFIALAVALGVDPAALISTAAASVRMGSSRPRTS